jgi:hypothetical protein
VIRGSDDAGRPTPPPTGRSARRAGGRTPDEDAIVEFVELPLHPDPGRADVPGLQADQLTPSQPAESLEHDGDELVVAPGQQRGPLGDEQDAERPFTAWGTPMSR